MNTEEESLLVSICCLAYNHEPYIRQCLDGFMMQKTNFSFEVLIHDDASTDKTADIIREYEVKYPAIIKPIYQIENQYSKGVGVTRVYQFPRAQGKYIALCEGDDYWTDPLKLQKQVDFLEANPEYGMVHTHFIGYNMVEKEFEEVQKNKIQDCSFRNLLKANSIGTLTALYRKEYNNQAIEEGCFSQGFLMGDYPLWLYISTQSKIKFLEDCTAVYRILPESASHTNDPVKKIRFEESVLKIKIFFADKYDAKDIIQTETVRFNRKKLKIAKRNYLKKEGKEAFEYLKKSGEVKLKDYIPYYCSQYKFFYFLYRQISRK